MNFAKIQKQVYRHNYPLSALETGERIISLDILNALASRRLDTNHFIDSFSKKDEKFFSIVFSVMENIKIAMEKKESKYGNRN